MNRRRRGGFTNVAAVMGGGSTLTQPYNTHAIFAPGDSRTAQAGGLSGAYGVSTGVANSGLGAGTGIDSFTPAMMGNAIRWGAAPNPGIGGQTGVQALSYPRPIGLGLWTGRIDNGTAGNAGNTLTISAINGGDVISVGTRITGTGITPCIVTAILTGTGGIGTFTVDGAAQNVASTATIQPQYVYGQAVAKTIADVAAHEAAIVFMWLGTNNSVNGSAGLALDLAAIDVAINALTNPAYVHPGYGSVLPLYNGQPKTVVLLNETRRGITTTNTVNQQLSSTNAAAFSAFATSLKRYSFDSGNATYANSHVVVVDTFNDPSIADLTDTTTYNPLPGFFADGLHPAPPGSFALAKIINARLLPLLTANANYGVVPTTATAASFPSSNPNFTTTTGGVSSLNSHTLTGTVPSGWRLLAPSGSGLNFDLSYTALGGVLGNEVVIHITGTPSVDGTLQFDQQSTSGQRVGVNTATDTVRAMCRAKLTITSGTVTNATLFAQLSLGGANLINSSVGGTGSKLGYNSTPAYSLLEKNAYASVENTAYITYATKNLSIAPYGATGTPTVLETYFQIGMVAGVATDITLTLSQFGIAKVTD